MSDDLRRLEREDWEQALENAVIDLSRQKLNIVATRARVKECRHQLKKFVVPKK